MTPLLSLISELFQHLWLPAALLLGVLVVLKSIHRIGETEVGLVTKRVSLRKLSEDSPVALRGEAGYQADLLQPGLQWKLWPIYKVRRWPWVQVPAGEIGVVIAQVGSRLPIGAKSAVYKGEFGNFTDLRSFVQNGGQKGVQRPVFSPGTLAPMHPVGFLVLTRSQVYGLPVSPELRDKIDKSGHLAPEAFGLTPRHLELVRIQTEPAPAVAGQPGQAGQAVDMMGIVTTYEGDPLPSGVIASRIGGFEDLERMEKESTTDAKLIETLIGSKNTEHNNYQDFQKFLDKGGKIGLQHDPLLYGAYALNPFLVSVEKVPMLLVKQGQVAVIKAYVGLSTEDTSGAGFKFGSLVKPGHRGIWHEPLRTGKYPINPRCYQAEIVPTAILTLNWADAVSHAHDLDAQLQQIVAKSKEGFVFHIDLQVQIHVADFNAPKVISMVGTMFNLVNEVLQAAVGNHFRNTLQSMPAVEFIENRQAVQQAAVDYITSHLNSYNVETRGVYIQDVILPQELVEVLTSREIANQRIATFKKEEQAERQRIDMENAKGLADVQADLARSKVGVDINRNDAEARKAQADGEATYIRETGKAKGAEVEAVGLARATAYEKQVDALGQDGTTLVNVITALAEKQLSFVPNILVSGGSGAGAFEGLAATLMGRFGAQAAKLSGGGGGTAVAEKP